MSRSTSSLFRRMGACAIAALFIAGLFSCGGDTPRPAATYAAEESAAGRAADHVLAPGAAATTAFAARVSVAPADKSTISGTVYLEVKGSNLANVELLPAQGYAPKIAIFAISADKTTAWTMLDTTKLPEGIIVARISAFNAPAGSTTAKEIVAMPARTWTVKNQVTPGTFSARVTEAPANGATLSGPVRLVVTGSNLQNVELLPASGYTPKYATFRISADRTRAIAIFDTLKLPSGSRSFRISAFNAPAGSTTAREIVAMPTRTWNVSNVGAWHITDLGPLEFPTAQGSRIINDAGEVIGMMGSRAYVYRNGQTVDLGTLGSAFSYARGINNYGHVVGSSSMADSSKTHAALFKDGSVTDIGRLFSASDDSIGQDINDAGDIVLTVRDRPYLLTNNGRTTASLDYLRQQYTRAMGINNAGQIILNYGMKYATAVFFSAGNAVELGLPPSNPSFPNHVANGMNNGGVVVGASDSRFFMYTESGGMIDMSASMGNQIYPHAINDSMQIVGQALQNQVFVPFFYSRGRMLFLNSFPEIRAAGWTLDSAYGINNAGQIVGVGVNRNGQRHAYLLTPPGAGG